MAFSAPLKAAPKRRAADDIRGSAKAPRYQPREYCSSADVNVAHYDSNKETSQELLLAETKASYKSISDDESLPFDGLYPVLPTSPLQEAKQTHSPEKKLIPTPKTFVPPLKGVASTSRTAASQPGLTAAVPDSPSAPWAQGTTLAQKWATRPNKRAWEIVDDVSNPQKSIVNEVQEPEYALRDVEISEGLDELKNLMCEFGEAHFKFEIRVASSPRARQIWLKPDFFAQFSQETVKVVGCVASGGPGGVLAWHKLFIEPTKRMALVLGIIGNVLVEQVFQHMFFGGTEKHVAELVKLQEKHADEDGMFPNLYAFDMSSTLPDADFKTGFVRNTHYATSVRSILDPKATNSCTLPTNFANHVNYIVGVLVTHLEPIVKLDPSSPSASILISKLHTIVTHAGLLSLSMRADPHTVYHFTPIFKEEIFSHSRMECFNGFTMQQTNPHTPDADPGLLTSEKKRRAKLSKAEKKRSRNDDALTQITLMDGVTAYRLGGWEMFDSKVTNVRYEKMEYATQGVRERVLSKAWTYCRWGRARAFKDGKADDVAAYHGVAWNGGFADFTAVDGVEDWLENERASRRRKVREVTEAEVQAQLNEE
ncbi:hypothetical protein DE146DRAFT_618984 [Phaeosphaeria sp. MPI-PUGE-AT-0046c]|nr:hypothetical protein DE146DRAFT_618984 [Phaeosphaeria sp. MPI-PUGE-AT-0046c]